jgi:tRNA dimethylallyltransferase
VTSDRHELSPPAGTGAGDVPRAGERVGAAGDVRRAVERVAAAGDVPTAGDAPPAGARAAAADEIPPAGTGTVVALFGPTGVGKTAVAIALADLLRAEGEDPVAVSADALQLYRGLETLTGAATPAERARLEHRLVGVLPVTARASAGDYARRAHAEIDGLLAQGRRPIVVGGTGLYLRAALTELDLRPPPDPAIRARRRQQLAARGAPALHAELAERDPRAAAAVLPTDAQRVVRALELLDAGAAPPAPAEGAGGLWTAATRHPTLLAALTMERDALYTRIDARVEAMVAAGAPAEVRAAAAQGASPGARQALGFEALLEGDVEGMRRATRRYAKRQLTWLRKLPGIVTIDVTGRDPQAVALDVRSALRAAADSSSPPMNRENGPTTAQ